MQIGNDPKTQLRQAINQKGKDLSGGWVLVCFPGDGPIAVQAFDQMSKAEVLAALTLGESIMIHDILFGEDEDEPDAS